MQGNPNKFMSRCTGQKITINPKKVRNQSMQKYRNQLQKTLSMNLQMNGQHQVNTRVRNGTVCTGKVYQCTTYCTVPIKIKRQFPNTNCVLSASTVCTNSFGEFLLELCHNYLHTKTLEQGHQELSHSLVYFIAP
jgi:hypothetical protein